MLSMGMVVAGWMLQASAEPATKRTIEWKFGTPADSAAWVANSFLANVKTANGVLQADTVGWDPFFVCKGQSIPATAWQYVVLRIKASKAGTGELFWSGETTGKYDGFSQEKTTPFSVKGGGEWEDVVLFPYWQAEGTIRQFRLDLYDSTHFEIDSLRILEWGREESPADSTGSWAVGERLATWRIHPSSDLFMVPCRKLKVSDRPWVTVVLKSGKDFTASVVWSVADVRGLQSRNFSVRGDGKLRHYNIELSNVHEWHDPVVALGLRLPEVAGVEVSSIGIGEEPKGPPEIRVEYFGFESGVNRVGNSCEVIAQLSNVGGSPARGLKATLVGADGLSVVGPSATQAVDDVDYSELTRLSWRVRADRAGTFGVQLAFEGVGAEGPYPASLRFAPAMKVEKQAYVPEPRPVATDIDVCAYYFPGWESPARWDCIRRVAPIRKPVLGYYDEANPECVDWQIKWAVENGITCFLVDWYWIKGQKHLEHWFEAYRKSRYRKYLKVAIMWANHNPPGSHSVEDWRNVTREWIEKYFPLESYYQMDGRPAVFIWDTRLIRGDLKGTEVVAKTFAESQEMAKAAGHKGIHFVVMNIHESPAGVETLLKEGYRGATHYHEWGAAVSMSKEPLRARYEDIVTSVRATWESHAERCGRLTYHPVVDTGWDSRPWHGARSLVITGRTPDRFEEILRQAREFCTKTGRKMVILGPMNEWGEGSYIEPNLEFGFEMMERIRKVFGKGDPSSWPVNLAPADVGRGPYDLPVSTSLFRWTFDRSADGWGAMMGVHGTEVRDGAFRFQTQSRDPAIMAATPGLRTKKFERCIIRMSLEGSAVREDSAQMFFSVNGQAAIEETSFRFPVKVDGQMHEYRVDLKTVPRWRSMVSSLRFDPCNTSGVKVAIDSIVFE